MSLGKRIGIGTTQPESFLHVVSDAGSTIPAMIIQAEQPGLEMRVENGDVISSLVTDEADKLVITNTVGGIVFRTGATADPVLTLTDDGNLEITGTIFQNGEEFVGGGGGDSLPIGSFFKYPWPTDPARIPAGYLKCDGSLISRTDFADLFSVIGTLYGEGDGSTTFAVPTFSNHIIKFSSTAPAETVDFLPIGSTLLIPWTIDPYPAGYLKCDGREVSREVYSLLFANVGTEFGVGDGSTTFNLPILSNHGIKFQTTIKGDLDDIVPWAPSSQAGDIYYPGNVGVGISNPVERLHVSGNILVNGNVIPAENETYDLGTATSAFRDLYLSGDTIFLGNTKITADPVTGSVSFLDKDTNEVRNIVSENTQNISLSETGDTLILSGNVGVGTTTPTQKLDVVGSVNLSSGSALKINGSDVITGNGLGTGVTSSSLTSVGTLSSLLVSGNVGFGTTDPGASRLWVQGTGGTGVDLFVNGNERVDGQLLIGPSTGSSRLEFATSGTAASVLANTGIQRTLISGVGRLLFRQNDTTCMYFEGGEAYFGDAKLATPTGSAPLYAARAWVNFTGATSGTTMTINSQGNVSSVVRIANYDYRVNFTTAMPSVHYSAVATFTYLSGQTYGFVQMASRSGQTSGSCRFFTHNTNNSPATPEDVMFVAFH